MPRQRETKQLPRPMTQLAVVMEGKPLPRDADKVFKIVRDAMKDEKHNPLTTVNRQLGQLKRRDPASLKAMGNWLCDPINGQQLARLGQSSNRTAWAVAIEKILDGNTATSAFGSKPGPKPSWRFSKYHRLGIQVLYKIRIDKLKPEKAIAQVLDKEGLVDDRDLRRSYSIIKIMDISDQKLQQLSKS
jgi:hypothetical protein